MQESGRMLYIFFPFLFIERSQVFLLRATVLCVMDPLLPTNCVMSPRLGVYLKAKTETVLTPERQIISHEGLGKNFMLTP